jgi:hypothetical protein
MIMANLFSQSEIFPVIARLILAESQAHVDAYASHDRIVQLLLNDPDGAALIAQAVAKSKNKKAREISSNMIAWFSKKITDGKSEWAGFFERTRPDGRYAYRSVLSSHSGIGDDVDLYAMEGNVKLYLHIKRERNQSLVKGKREAVLKTSGKLACEACGLETAERYPGLGSDVCEVHHRAPLSDSEFPSITGLDDLALLCPSCHRAIHRTKPMMTVETFRATFLLA